MYIQTTNNTNEFGIKTSFTSKTLKTKPLKPIIGLTGSLACSTLSFDNQNNLQKSDSAEFTSKVHNKPNLLTKFINCLASIPKEIAFYKTNKKLTHLSGIWEGKKVSLPEILKIISKEKDIEVLKKALATKFEICDSIKDDEINLITKRNKFARWNGFSSYYEYLLKKNYNTDIETLNKEIDSIYSELKPTFEKTFAEHDKNLKEKFNTDKLEEYHYRLNFNSARFDVLNEVITKYGGVQLAKKIYSGMGFDIDKLINEGKLKICKDNCACSFHRTIKIGERSEIHMQKFLDKYSDLHILCHELGHAMYNLEIPKTLPHEYRKDASKSLNEGIAIMMSCLILNENIFANDVPKDTLEEIKKNYNKDKIIRLAIELAMTEFEQEMYADPKQDLAKLWQAKIQKYTGWNYPASNGWIVIPHFTNHPAYRQNYIRGAIISEQLYSHLKEKFGNLTENRDVAKYLIENIFSKGASMSESELLKKLTGKELDAEAYIKNLQ